MLTIIVPACPRAQSPVTNIPDQRGTFVTVDEPALTHRYHPESVVYGSVHSWCTFCEFRQMYNGLCLPL